MRFSAPRSLSPSPTRHFRNSRSAFRAPTGYDSSDEEISSDEDNGDEVFDNDISVESQPLNSSDEGGDSEENDDDVFSLSQLHGRQRRKDPNEERLLEETLVAIRLRTRYKDPYEVWERGIRKDAFQTARTEQCDILRNLREQRRKAREAEATKQRERQKHELDFLQQRLSSMHMRSAEEEQKVMQSFKARERLIWERIEGAIKKEEEKVRNKLEMERRMREEAERRRKEEEERRRKEEEKRRQEEERRKQEEEEKRRVENEEKERQEAAKKKKEQEESHQEMRTVLGMQTQDQLWQTGLETLRHLKTKTMRAVKGPKPPDPEPPGYTAPPAPPLKKLWSAQRRKITPKVGQITDDPQQIARIIEELKAIVAPVAGVPEPDSTHLHHALLSSLSKSFISQAETEVTAHKEQALLLARVAISLVVVYPFLGDIFWAKLCELTGCWAAGVENLLLDDERFENLSEKEKMKRSGVRKDESSEGQTIRIAGVLRLYFAMIIAALDIPISQPLPPQFRPGRYWLYLSHLLNSERTLGKTVAPEAIYVALDVGGARAKELWGKQFVKMLQVIYENVQGEGRERIGGSEVTAQASRARCQLEIEKIMAG